MTTLILLGVLLYLIIGYSVVVICDYLETMGQGEKVITLLAWWVVAIALAIVLFVAERRREANYGDSN